MRVKVFSAPSVREALSRIKGELGPQAVILKTEQTKGKVEITAASDVDYPPLQRSGGRAGGIYDALDQIREKVDSISQTLAASLPLNQSPLFKLYLELLGRRIGEEVSLQLINNLREVLSPEADGDELKSQILSQLSLLLPSEGIRRKPKGPNVVALIGPTGVGKTTTISKLAVSFSLLEKRRVALISIDTFRPAAGEELEEIAQALGIPLQVAKTPGSMGKALRDFRDRDFVFVDTAGHSYQDSDQISELMSFLNRRPPPETHLVLSTATKPEDNLEAWRRFRSIPIQKLLFTKLDETLSPGGMVETIVKTKRPVSYLTNGQRIPEDLWAAENRPLAEIIMGERTL